MTKRLLTARELADLLGFSPATIVDWAEREELPSFKIGNRLRFRLSEIEGWLETKRRPGAGGTAPTIPSKHPTEGVVSQVPTIPNLGGTDAC
jgi:excisionase family DNA binding protein